MAENRMNEPNEPIAESQESGSSKEKQETFSAKKEIFSWIKIILLALVISFVLNHYIIVSAEVPTGSMENTIMIGDRIIASRLSYHFHEPQRGDIIVFNFPDDESQKYLKRIIGLPGETVKIKDGKVYINDSKTPLKEDYLRETPVGDYGPYTVPKDSYFLMGDNRNDSFDSRFWEHTFATRDEIIGKAEFRYYPMPKLLK
ncbi:signal peptidase I Serine peptidase. MEROPS family S26A [Anaerocolumna jejuensis DSM 15929]|jgi:signal peptidase I|uniref:Signal peptidase I n=1 Tax=Anaerocolumna jejuensis DSM 15929 TaxID=1121322 RepID=A0A1M6XLI7_9FIRM|nr:signal peptidase I [Anaerocolumna jejuensis]SHL06882.1 signal peptidase I Serine peptidase. MEROPS family S26A [Anaerocolumna jejuensis DSM 15929]